MKAHLPILPVLLPFAAGLLLLALRDLPMATRRRIATISCLIQIAVAGWLVAAVADGAILVYRLGDWPAPWGIVLVADRLAAWLVLTATLLALCAVIHAGDGTDRQGRHFHVLFQLQLFGIALAFLTGDLFNLFVAFEILLIASYGLLLHGGGAARTRAGLHYVALNLVGSALFLFAAGLIYASLGTLNLADIVRKATSVAPENLGLARAGGLLLFVVFSLKAALLPLFLWLPGAYAATAAPVAALFAILTKVGVYALLRAATLPFGADSGELAGLFAPWRLPLALATLAAGTLGALAAPSLARLSAWLTIASIGLLLTAFSIGSAGIAAGLYYLPHSSFAVALLFLLAEALRRRRVAAADFFTPEHDMARHALWGGLFFFAAVAAAGLPPLSGFLAKFMILRAVPGGLWFAILLSALLIVIALARAGSALFFSTKSVEAAPAGSPARLIDMRPDEAPDPPSAPRELAAIAGLVALILALTLAAGPAARFVDEAARQLATPQAYVEAVLGEGER